MKTAPSFTIGRRTFLGTLGGIGAAALLGGALSRVATAAPRKGRLKQGVCRGVFKGLKLDFDGQCREAARLGAYGIDLVSPAEFETLKKYGLIATMVHGGSGMKKGINDKANHAETDTKMREAIKAASIAGAPNIVVLSGDRSGLTDEQGIENSVVFFNNIKGLAEEKNVTLCMELLNSKRNHKDYQCDHVAWGVELVKRISSERFKLLYDIYHMQIMDGDVCDTIKENHQYFDHYHTAGVPGRHEIDDSQELNYPPIMKAIVATGFKGYVAQEFSPTKPDRIASLRQAIQICDV